MKVKSLIISLILIVCFAGIGIGLYCAWPAITGTITDSKYYTSEDLQEAYDKGYNDAFKNKDELTQQVDYYKELTDTYYISILDYQAQIKDYETLTENNKNTISILEQNKTELQSQVDNLTTIKNSNEETISNLQVEVISLENQVKILTTSDSSKTEEIAELNKQITSLNNLISQLQNTNTLNVNTIASLNSQIESLNSQISNMILQNQTASSQITALNNEISKLQESINYYEQYIASLENGEQVVATFEFDGSVYNIQILNKNSIVTVTTPTSTDYVIFNYWTVNGEQVDLSTYQITTNTKFVANVTYKYDVKFKVDNTDYDSQIVVKNGYATLPEEPTKAGYEFDGWSINGIDIVENISTTAVTQNVTYKAVFTQLHTVTFMSDGEIKSTQSVRNGEYANYSEIPVKTNYKFEGWSINGIDIIELSSYPIYSSVVFNAIFSPTCLNTLVEVSWNGLFEFDGRSVWVDNENVYYSYGVDQYKLNKETNTWEEMTWYGVSDFIILDLFYYKENVYCCDYKKQFKLNRMTNTWEEMTWNGLPNVSLDGTDFWTDGDDLYYSSGSQHYILNENQNTWEEISWNGMTSFYGSYVWSDGENIYYSSGENQFKFNKEINTWEEMTWYGLSDFNLNGKNIWSDGENYYYSFNSNQYVLNKETNTWEELSWNGMTSFSGVDVWSDGENFYYSSDEKQYMFISV